MSISQSGAQAAALTQLQTAFPVNSSLLPSEQASLQQSQQSLAASMAAQAVFIQQNAIVNSNIPCSVDGKTGATIAPGSLS